MKTYSYKQTKVSLRFESYRNNGTLAVAMDDVSEEDLYAVITVNLNSPLQSDTMAFLDENNHPGIGAWLQKKGIAFPLGYAERSGFCTYPLYSFNRHE